MCVVPSKYIGVVGAAISLHVSSTMYAGWTCNLLTVTVMAKILSDLQKNLFN